MSTLAVILIVVGGVLVLLFTGGLVYTVVRERRTRHSDARRIAQADRALAHASAADRGWSRELLEQAARDALARERPKLPYESLELVLVDDRPGISEDRAHFVARSRAGPVRLVLCRDESGWSLERLV